MMFRRFFGGFFLVALATSISFLSVSPVTAALAGVTPDIDEPAKCTETNHSKKYEKWGANCDGWHIKVTKKSAGSISIGTIFSGLHSVIYGETQSRQPAWAEFKPNQTPLILGEESGWGGPKNITMPFISWPAKKNFDQTLAPGWARFITVRSTADIDAATAEVRCGIFLDEDNDLGFPFAAFDEKTALNDVGCSVLDRIDENGDPLLYDTSSGYVDPTQPIRAEFQEVEDGEWKQH